MLGKQVCFTGLPLLNFIKLPTYIFEMTELETHLHVFAASLLAALAQHHLKNFSETTVLLFCVWDQRQPSIHISTLIELCWVYTRLGVAFGCPCDGIAFGS